MRAPAPVRVHDDLAARQPCVTLLGTAASQPVRIVTSVIIAEPSATLSLPPPHHAVTTVVLSLPP